MPGMKGGRTFISASCAMENCRPERKLMSVGLTVAAATRMRTSPAPGLGTGRSDTNSSLKRRTSAAAWAKCCQWTGRGPVAGPPGRSHRQLHLAAAAGRELRREKVPVGADPHPGTAGDERGQHRQQYREHGDPQ